MAGIGEVIFLKAVIVTVGAAGVARYKSQRKQSRAAGGVPLRYDERRQVHVLDDSYARFERKLRIAAWVLGVPTAIYTAFVLYVIFSA